MKKTVASFFAIVSLLCVVSIPRLAQATSCSQSTGAELHQKSTPYQYEIYTSSRRYGVSPALIKAVISAESCFRDRAVSHKGAGGLMQLMPGTARRFGASDRFDPEQNIDAGTGYLRWLLNRYRGSVAHAVAAYNAGEGRVDYYGANVPFAETQNYTRQVLSAYNKLGMPAGRRPQVVRANYQRPPQQGFQRGGARMQLVSLHFSDTDLRGLHRAVYRPVPVRWQAPARIAQADGCSSNLNQALLKNTQRQGGGSYSAFFYKVGMNDSLLDAARKTGVNVQSIAQLNRISPNAAPAAGQMLKVAECRS